MHLRWARTSGPLRNLFVYLMNLKQWGTRRTVISLWMGIWNMRIRNGKQCPSKLHTKRESWTNLLNWRRHNKSHPSLRSFFPTPMKLYIDFGTHNLLLNCLTWNNKCFPGNSPVRTEIFLNVIQLPNAAAKRYAFKKANWQEISESTEVKPF